MFLQYSITVTSEPRDAKTEANSKPITPPPITVRRFGTSFRRSMSEEDSTPGVCAAPGTLSHAGCEPVATMMRSAVNSLYSENSGSRCSTAADSASVGQTRTVCASTRRAMPFTMSTPFSRVSTPERSCATTSSLRSTIRARVIAAYL